MYPLLITVKEIDLMSTTGILLRVKADPLAFLVANSSYLSRIFKSDTNNYFHVVPGYSSHKM